MLYRFCFKDTNFFSLEENKKLNQEGKTMETICVQKREGAIKAKKLRRLGFIPANVFGKTLPDPISIQLKESDARRLIS